MFETGFGELVLLFVIGLLVLGPQRLPKVAAEIGKWVGRARRTASELRRQLEREIELSEIAKSSPPPQTPPTTDTEPTPLPPDPFSAEAQHGPGSHSGTSGDSSASPAAEAGSPAAPAAPPESPAATEPAPQQAPEAPPHSEEPVSSPSQH
ncbi:MAG TPA: Sec-independent protein translocase protein TatB [Gammaproteobacteria bacterium]|jgi:sec-independent protein translocase protein TatB|nr:Sec-independent protein translocase protein TatB [Gammaproteobacteria bacterium]